MKVIRHDVVESTNEVAKELIAEGTSPWTVVTAQKQVAGRGRHGRGWASPRGGLYVSIILQEKLSRIPVLSVAAGLAIVDVLGARGLPATLKWPNDVLLHGAKVAGILAEGVGRHETYWCVLGIGLNSNVPLESLPASLPDGTTTLRHELGRPVDNDRLLDDLLASLQGTLPPPGREGEAMARYRRLCETLGQSLVVDTPEGRVEGEAIDITPEGFLVIATPKGTKAVIAEGSLRP